MSTIDSGLRTQDSGLKANYAQIKFEDFQHEILDEIYDSIAPHSDMAHNERYFLNGIIRYFKPKKILEVGVSKGGGSAIILNAIKDLDSQLISVDYCEKYYGGNTDKLSGYIVDENFPQLKNKWTIYRGGDISKFIEKIGSDIDLLVLDTAHIHPWETLNFLCVLPFMKKDSWCVLHDVSLPMLKYRENDLACRLLFGHVVSDYKLMPVSDHESYFANIGVFHIIDDTRKYIGNLFESLLVVWEAMPEVFNKKIFPCATPMLPEDINSIRNIINKYYPDYVNFFEQAINYQKIIVRHKIEMYNYEHKSLKGILKHYMPITYEIYKKLMRK